MRISHAEAADLIGISKANLSVKVHRKQVPHYRLSGRQVVFDREELLAWLESRRIPSSGRVYASPMDERHIAHAESPDRPLCGAPAKPKETLTFDQAAAEKVVLCDRCVAQALRILVYKTREAP